MAAGKVTTETFTDFGFIFGLLPANKGDEFTINRTVRAEKKENKDL
jgi:hypothetical protein